MIKKLFYLLMLCTSISFAETKNPVENYNKTFSTKKTFYFKLDINSDGIEDYFLTNELNDNSTLGYIWNVYLSSKGSFYLQKEPLVFEYKRLLLRKNMKNNIKLFHYTVEKNKAKGDHLRLNILISTNGTLSFKQVATLKVENHKIDDDIIGIFLNDGTVSLPSLIK